MNHDYEVAAILELVQDILKAGFRPFIAERGTYGFFTDVEGTRIISFEYGLSGIKFSGNYKTSEPKSTGTGWELGESLDSPNFQQLFASGAPRWAVGDARWNYTTLEQHLRMYLDSSKYVEVAINEMPKLSMDDIKALIPHIVK